MGDRVAGEVRVEPALLDRAQQVCVTLREQVAADGHGVEDVTTEAARGLPGWATQRALEDLAWWWRDDLTRLGGYLDKFGAALHQTAAAYRSSDHASVDLFDIRGR